MNKLKINSRQKELLESRSVAVASINQDGSPNVIAIGFARIQDDSLIVITDNFMKQTSENIQRDPRVCLAVWTDDWKEGY